MDWTLLAAVLLIQALAVSSNSSLRYSKVISHIRDNSDPDVIPISAYDDGPLEVTLDLALVNILDVDVQKNEIELVLWQALHWQNKALAWDPEDPSYNASKVTIPAHYLWLPDLAFYQAVYYQEILTPSVAQIDSTGKVTYVPSIRIRVSCDLKEVETGAACNLKVGSWAYDGFTLSLTNNGRGLGFENYVTNSNYEIVSQNAERNALMYPCCPEPYIDVTYSFELKAKDEGRNSGYEK